MVAYFGEEEIFVVRCVAPVWLRMGGARRCRRGGRRGWRAGELLVEVGRRRGHARGRGTSNVPTLRHLVHPLIQHYATSVQGQLLAQHATSPLREAQRSLVAVHGRVEAPESETD